MTLTIVATPNSASANSFATEAEVIAYMAARLNASTWTTLSGTTCTESEKAAMIEAARDLTLLTYLGAPTTDTQALAWGRAWAPNPDDPWGTYFDQTVVPTRVKLAQAELAFQYLKAGTTDLAALDSNVGVIEKTVDVLTTRWQPYVRPTGGIVRFPRVVAYLAPLLADVGNSARILRA